MDAGLAAIVGGHMTQKEFLWGDGGYIHSEAPEVIYRRAVQQGIRSFVVPGNQPDLVQKYRRVLYDEFSRLGILEDVELFAPGFIKQGGVISETGRLQVNAGTRLLEEI